MEHFKTHHDAVLVRNVMAQVFFSLLLQPDQLERPLEAIAAAHSTLDHGVRYTETCWRRVQKLLDHSILLGQREGPLKAKPSLDLFHLGLLQRGSVPLLLPALLLPLLHLFRGTFVVADLLIPNAR